MKSSTPSTDSQRNITLASAETRAGIKGERRRREGWKKSHDSSATMTTAGDEGSKRSPKKSAVT